MKPMIAALSICLLGVQGIVRAAPYDDGAENAKVAWADVLRVDPVYRTDRPAAPERVCEEMPIEHPSNNGNRAAGTVLGAIVGGVLGSTVGKGDGRKVATVAGAVAGGAIGNSVARGDGSGYADTEPRCHFVDARPPERRVVAYDVQYRYRGDVFMSRLGYDPGDRLRIRISIEPVE